MSKTLTQLWLLKSEEERGTEPPLKFLITTQVQNLVNHEESRLLESNLTNH